MQSRRLGRLLSQFTEGVYCATWQSVMRCSASRRRQGPVPTDASVVYEETASTGWEHHSMTLQYLSEEQRVTAIVHAKLPLPF